MVYIRRNAPKRRGFGRFYRFLFAAVLCAALAGGIAWAWQIKTTPPGENPFSDGMLFPSVKPAESAALSSAAPSQPQKPAVSASGSTSSGLTSSSSSQSVSSAVLSSAGSESVPQSSQAASSPPSSAAPESSASASESPVGSNKYFDDAVFVGDSITTGIKLYDVMANAKVFAATGMSLDNIFSKELVEVGGEKLTVLDALKVTDPKKIYIMLGANSLGAEEWALSQYERLIGEVIGQHPHCIVYIQSVLPIYEPTFSVRYGTYITNAQIDRFNEKLAEISAQKGAVYLDVASAFKDETGGMPSEYTPDGIHINPKQYTMWFDYLKAHEKSDG